ncbi:MAG TPA: anthranilate phosphoribosyltransferase [Gemmatimonadaceae bacterium]|nr:anthranilate phosphoribosyltransferase [Gemmatimonadaceae bacterium]
MSADPLRLAIRRLAAGDSLSMQDTADAFDVIMRGEASQAQVAAILMALRVKGETAAEVAGGARAMRRAMLALPAHDPASLVDTCGTGGGSISTFNISTAAALLAAGAGVRIAKHGNRSFTSQCGSADVLEALGVRIEMPVDAMRRVLDETGIVFMYAPIMHPAMRHVGPVRRDLAIGTVMNILGPLANPAGAGRQVVGVSDHTRLPLLAGALAALESRHAMVVYGEPGLDEISPLGCTHVHEVRDGAVQSWTLDPERFGMGNATEEELAGGTPADNASAIVDVLRGRRHGGARWAVLLNAAAAIYVAGARTSYADALTLAQDALDDGRGLDALERLRRATQAHDTHQ